MIYSNIEILQRRIEKYCNKADFIIEASDTIIPVATLVFKDNERKEKKIIINDGVKDLSSLYLSIKPRYFRHLFILTKGNTKQLFTMTVTSGGKFIFELIPNNPYFNSFVNENKLFFSIAGFNGLFGISSYRVSYVEFMPEGDYVVGGINHYIKNAIKNKRVIPISNSGFIRNQRRLISK